MESEELIERFIDLEEKNEFFNLKIEKIKFWLYIRFDIYTCLMQNYGLYNKNVSPDAQFSRKVDLVEFIKRMTVKNQFFLRKKDILIFSCARKVKENTYYKCVYTDLISKNLDNTYYIFDDSYEGIYYFPRNVSGIKNLDIDSYRKLNNKKEISFNGQILEENIYSIIEKEFDKPLTIAQKKQINSYLVNVLNTYNDWKKYYYHILKKIKPKLIMIVCYYGFKMMLLCETAKELGIPVVELQHGTMGKEHIAYNFLKKRRLKSFPAIAGIYGYLKKSDDKEDIVVLKRYKRYYGLTSEWLSQIITGRDSVKEYLDQYGYKNIAIYGMGSIAELLSKQLKKYNDNQVKYYIDKNGKELYYGLDGVEVIDIEGMDKMQDVDVIIVTAVADYNEIIEEIGDRANNVKIVSLEEIVNKN